MRLEVGDKFYCHSVRSVVTVSAIVNNGEHPSTYFCRYSQGDQMLFTYSLGPSIHLKYKRLLEEMIA